MSIFSHFAQVMSITSPPQPSFSGQNAGRASDSFLDSANRVCRPNSIRSFLLSTLRARIVMKNDRKNSRSIFLRGFCGLTEGGRGWTPPYLKLDRLEIRRVSITTN